MSDCARGNVLLPPDIHPQEPEIAPSDRPAETKRFRSRLDDMSPVRNAVEQSFAQPGLGNTVFHSENGRFNAESSFMLRVDSHWPICIQIDGFSLRITGVAFSMAIN
jgi:hypothetical protein